MPDAAPIVVNASPAPDQLVVALRQLALTLSPIATYYGATHTAAALGQIAVAVGPIVAVVTIIMGQIHQNHQSTKLATMAAALPDQIAKVKT